MTAIVGVVGEDGSVYMGGDSAGTTDHGDQFVLSNPKVFVPVKAPWFVIGVCGSCRTAQLLQYSIQLPPPPSSETNLDGYMAMDFVDVMRKAMHKAGASQRSEHGLELGGTFLVGYQGHLYRVEDNYQALRFAKNYAAVGSGETAAHGSLFSTEGQDAGTRVETALQAAAYCNAAVRPPFTILKLPFYSDWHRKAKAKKRVTKK